MFVYILLEKETYVISYHLFLRKLSLGCMKIRFGRDCRLDNHLDVKGVLVLPVVFVSLYRTRIVACNVVRYFFSYEP